MTSANPDEFDPREAARGGPSEADLNAQREIEAQKDMLLKKILEPPARARLNNVKMVRPDLAGAVENYLIGAGAQGKLPSPITDEQLKQILLSAQRPKRDFRISRV